MGDQKELLSNTLALNLALQTIKERCVHLQKRLFALESENSKLRLNTLNSDKKDESQSNVPLSEIQELRAKNAELTLQKSQLTENLSMISTENRKLWKRLSQLTKENINDEISIRDEEITKAHSSQNLIRSKTFTQNSPHQLLKERLVGPDESELEDISLLNDCGFTTDKINFVSDDCETFDVDSKTCTEGMLNIKRELMKQNSDLKVALSNWKKMKTNEFCSCKKTDANAKKPPLMVDKNLETDRVLTVDLRMETESPNRTVAQMFEMPEIENIIIDLNDQKRAADLADKICPMCGKFYTQNILFEEFQEHVESHFRDENDLEQFDHNFEIVSHSVGNF
ncbi:CLUMA_CG003702, isoform A [Clunio marinus]|uniref:CLUMA_CG003702, isoform A n=1 Tax=Clunio marinus TaxID=568069 RepID=A0A1J1HU07_9DIPT|nr:CLUMA_CG003702, isoform A [Clunio marinus]